MEAKVEVSKKASEAKNATAKKLLDKKMIFFAR
jgi:hypothetical protein